MLYLIILTGAVILLGFGVLTKLWYLVWIVGVVSAVIAAVAMSIHLDDKMKD